MAITIKNITRGDLAKVVLLMREFAEYEHLTHSFTVTEEQLNAVMFEKNAFVTGLIAYDNDQAIAYALFYRGFSSFSGKRSFFLEDFYITERYRRHALGEKMLHEIARMAKRCGCERIDFHVLDWNKPAVNFYLKHGARRNDENRHFTFDGEALEFLAGSVETL